MINHVFWSIRNRTVAIKQWLLLKPDLLWSYGQCSSMNERSTKYILHKKRNNFDLSYYIYSFALLIKVCAMWMSMVKDQILALKIETFYLHLHSLGVISHNMQQLPVDTSATIPKSPFSPTSDLICCRLRPEINNNLIHDKYLLQTKLMQNFRLNYLQKFGMIFISDNKRVRN